MRAMSSGGRRITVVGLGNIGSHLVPHLARMPGIGRLTLVDPDVYSVANLAGQDVLRRDVGHAKVRVQARRLRHIDPELHVTAIRNVVQHVPLGHLRGDLILACLDSRRARQAVSEIAVHLGVPWIDAGVRADGLLVRIGVYLPGPDRPCMECAWGDADYAALEAIHDCAGETSSSAAPAPPTGAPSSLGALAAALQALECKNLLEGRMDIPAGARQVHLDVPRHVQFVTLLRRNPECRLAEHAAWTIAALDRGAFRRSLAQAFALVEAAGSRAPRRLWVTNRPFARRLGCPRCGAQRSLLRLADALRPRDRRCPRCGDSMHVRGFELLDALHEDALSERDRARTLRALGLRAGDVFSVAGRGEARYEIASERL